MAFLSTWFSRETAANNGALSETYRRLAEESIPITPERVGHLIPRAPNKQAHGLALEDYELLLNAQSGACAICHRPADNDHPLFVDHDHAIKDPRESVRGLLCGTCNTALGAFRDDPVALAAAIAYLKQPPARRILAQGAVR